MMQCDLMYMAIQYMYTIHTILTGSVCSCVIPERGGEGKEGVKRIGRGG